MGLERYLLEVSKYYAVSLTIGENYLHALPLDIYKEVAGTYLDPSIDINRIPAFIIYVANRFLTIDSKE